MGRRQLLAESGGSQGARRRPADGLVSAAVPELREAAWRASARLFRSACVPRARQHRFPTRRRQRQPGAAASVHARFLGPDVRSQRRLLDTGCRQRRRTRRAAFIPRLREIIAQNYPGTKLAITEYNFGALDDINGALAQADLLGIFGRQALGRGRAVGSAAAHRSRRIRLQDLSQLRRHRRNVRRNVCSSHQRRSRPARGLRRARSDGNLTAMVINKTGQDLSSALTPREFRRSRNGQVWRYSSANLNAIVKQPSVSVGAGQISHRFPRQFHHAARHPAAHARRSQAENRGRDQRGILRARLRARPNGGGVGQRSRTRRRKAGSSSITTDW